MKYFVIALLLVSELSFAQTSEKYPLPADVETLPGIISAAYEAISGEKGTLRQLERIKSLYDPNGMVSKNSINNGAADREVMSLDDFHRGFADQREYSFYEEETNREVKIFGTIATVWSTYQIRNIKDGPIVSRGINNIQLHYKDDRWWILCWSWDVEGEENKITEDTATSANFWAHRYNMEMDVAYGSDPAQRLDIYTQGTYPGEPTFFKRSEKKKPTLVWIHGGGWRFGNKETDAWFFAHFLERSWNVVNVEYRRGLGTAPDAAEDVLLVMKWIRDNAEEYSFDTNEIVVSGASAGGHLALLAGLINSVPKSHPSYVGDDIRIQAIINWYGVTDIEKIEAYLSANYPDGNFVLDWMKDNDKVAEVSKKYSPIHYVTKNAPPVLTIQGDLDSLTPYSQAQLLHEQLENVGAENQLLTLKGGKHLGFTEEQFQLIWKTIFKFLETHP